MNLAALASPGYRRYFMGSAFALNGLWLKRIALAWLAWEMTGRASFVGLVAFLMFAPTLLTGPIFGVIADRVAPKRAIALTQAGLAAGALALLVVSLAGLLEPALVAAIALLSGIVISAHHPVRLALVPALVPRSAIGSAVALSSVNFNLARLTGPAIGGAVIASLGIDWALVLTVACFLPTIAVLPGLEPRALDRPRPPAGILAALAEGLAYVKRMALVRRAMLVIAIFAVFARGLLEILPVLADGVFGRGPAGLGALTAAAGAGALIAAAATALGPVQAPGRLPITSQAGAAVGLALVVALAWAPSWPLALALTAALGLCGTMVGIGLQSSIQLVLPDGYRGRVMSLWTMVTLGGAALGAIVLGALIDLLGPRTALSAAGALALLLLGVVLARPLAPAADAGDGAAPEPRQHGPAPRP